jgi:hypothetical protein
MRRMQYGLIGIMLASTAIAASLSLWKCFPLMGFWPFLWTWIALQALHAVLVVWAFARPPVVAGPKRPASLLASSVAAIAPLLTLIVFVRVFVIGHSSNVAQMAADSGYDLWSLWFHVWPLLLFANLVAGLVAVIATVFPPYPPRHWASVAARFLAVLLVTFFPDA